MKNLKDTPFYIEAIQEINYSFGNFYLFDGFVVGEMEKDVVFTWEHHGKIVVEELSNLYDDNGKSLVYISNRVEPYSLVPSDWIQFFKHKYLLKGYGVISCNTKGILNILLEKLFMCNKVQSFNDLSDAINWARSLHRSKDTAA